jgi:hypothetical protein
VWALNSYGPGVWSAASNSITPQAPPRGIWGAGSGSAPGGYNLTINYITVTTTGNATYFGDISGSNANSAGACGSTTRCVWGGANNVNRIFYVEFATTGNTSSFGSLPESRAQTGAGNNATRGVYCGGQGDQSYSNRMDYITIASTGNAILFGTISPARRGMPSGVMSPTRIVFGGGEISPGDTATANMSFITTATTGNATSFGSMTSATYSLCNGASNSTRGLMKVGYNPSGFSVSGVDYITIATAGSATNFGNLSTARNGAAGLADTTRAVFGGGGETNLLEYFTIATTGNYTTFGTLTTTYDRSGASCSANGGVQ